MKYTETLSSRASCRFRTLGHSASSFMTSISLSTSFCMRCLTMAVLAITFIA